MQDQEQEKPKKTGWKDKVWGTIALCILALGSVAFWCVIQKLPHAEWRNEYEPLAWKAAGVRIDDAEAFWKTSAGDSRMELRAFCFPVCRLELDEAEGSGLVSVRFFNGEGVQMGDRLNIPYKDGKFIPRENNSMHVTETEATLRLEDGFPNLDEYTLHQVDQNAPLWRVKVECQPQGGSRQPLGYLSIVPNDL